MIIKECERLDYNPLILYYSLFNIVDYKTNIIGLWKDKGKIYIDRIDKVNIPIIHRDYLQYLINSLLHSGQICVAYKNVYNELVIDNGLSKTVLKNRIEHIVNKLSHNFIKELLNQYDGLTIYKLDNKYMIEIYY